MRALCTISFLLLIFCARTDAQSHRKLLVISIDGLDARYLKDADRLHLKIPTLRRMWREGAAAEGVVGVVPEDTWAAETTLVTGVTPALHGILTSQSPVQTSKAAMLWQAAAAKNMKTALIYWPATVGAEADYNCPQYWEGKPEADLPFEPISSKCTPGLVQRISSVYPRFSKSHWDDATALVGLRYLLQYEQPDLSLVHVADLGQEERETGALSLYSREVLENQDELIGQAITRLPVHTQVAIVSDHGFETEDYIVRPRVLIASNSVTVRHGLIGATNLRDAAALRKLIGLRKSGIAREIKIEEVRRLSPDVSFWVAAFSTMQNYVASESVKGQGVGPGSHKGVPAVWPTRPNVRSVFLLFGDSIRPVRLPEVSILQIAPTLADILGLKLPTAEGVSLWPKVRK